MGKRAILLFILLGLGCQSGGDGSLSGSGGAGAPPPFGGFGGTSVMGTGGTGAPAGPGGGYPGGGAPSGGSPGGGTPGTIPDASAPVTVDAGACPFNMAGQACGPAGATCSWSGDCVTRRCDCVNGTWACSERQVACGGTCPAPQTARCGDACTGGASGCLCHSGGGPNYAGCSCSGGVWQCAKR